jgi:hypothetical protein
MKKKFRTMFLLLTAIVISVAVTAQESTRRFSKSWPAGDVETLEIINKFGQVKISDNGSNQVTVEVTVTAEGSESRAKAILDDITVSFGMLGKKATAETRMATNFKSRNNFSIDYAVTIPASKNLNVSNKFGNVVLQNLTGSGYFDIGYGNLTAGRLEGSGPDGLKLKLEYGKADVEYMKEPRISLGYAKLFLKSSERIFLESKYSTVDADRIAYIRIDSKYDTFNFGSVSELEGDSKFTNYRIGIVEKRLRLISGYGTVRVEHIPADFERIEINNSYAQISLGIDPQAEYQVRATCDYCTVDYPKSGFTGNRMSENTKQTIDGKIAGGTKGQVSIISKYGNIKLVK